MPTTVGTYTPEYNFEFEFVEHSTSSPDCSFGFLLRTFTEENKSQYKDIMEIVKHQITNQEKTICLENKYKIHNFVASIVLIFPCRAKEILVHTDPSFKIIWRLTKCLAFHNFMILQINGELQHPSFYLLARKVWSALTSVPEQMDSKIKGHDIRWKLSLGAGNASDRATIICESPLQGAIWKRCALGIWK